MSIRETPEIPILETNQSLRDIKVTITLRQLVDESHILIEPG